MMAFKRIGLPVILAVMLVVAYFVKVDTRVELAFKNEAVPSADAKCDLKHGLVGCYRAENGRLEFMISYPDYNQDACTEILMHPPSNASSYRTSDGLSLSDRATRYSFIYNAMVAASAVYPKEYREEIDALSLYFIMVRAKYRRIFDESC